MAPWPEYITKKLIQIIHHALFLCELDKINFDLDFFQTNNIITILMIMEMFTVPYLLRKYNSQRCLQRHLTLSEQLGKK